MDPVPPGMRIFRRSDISRSNQTRNLAYITTADSGCLHVCVSPCTGICACFAIGSSVCLKVCLLCLFHSNSIHDVGKGSEWRAVDHSIVSLHPNRCGSVIRSPPQTYFRVNSLATVMSYKHVIFRLVAIVLCRAHLICLIVGVQ